MRLHLSLHGQSTRSNPFQYDFLITALGEFGLEGRLIDPSVLRVPDSKTWSARYIVWFYMNDVIHGGYLEDR